MSSEAYTAEIRIFTGNFAPLGWAFCNGQLMPIAQNTALFSLLGTTYGGDGKTTFGLPDLRGRVPMHPGSGPGLTPRSLGESGGTPTVTLTSAQMPPHPHAFQVSTQPGTTGAPAGAVLATSVGDNSYAAPQNLAAMDAQAVGATGSSAPHNNMQGFLSLNFIICLQGTWPPRS